MGRMVNLDDEKIRYARSQEKNTLPKYGPKEKDMFSQGGNSHLGEAEAGYIIETPAHRPGEWEAQPASAGVERQEGFFKSRQLLGRLNTEIKEKLAREMSACGESDPLPILAGIIDTYQLLSEEKQFIFQALQNELFGYGPLEAYMTDPSVTEVIYDAHSRGFIERDGILEEAGYKFMSPQDLEHYVQNLIKPVGRPLDERNTNLNAKLPDGTRINATCPPQSVEYTLNLRKPPATVRKFTPDDFVANGAATREMVDFLGYYHRKRANIIIVGATSTGKTTLIRILIENYSSRKERWVMLEETRELECGHPRYLSFQQVQRGKDKKDWFKLVDIFDQSVLRKRPDRIGVGEILGEEVVALIRGISAGHEGFIGSMHAGSPEKAVFLLVIKLKEAGLNLNEEYIRKIVHECLDFIVILKRMPEGRRVIDGVWEVLPLSAGSRINPFGRIYFYNHNTGRFEKDNGVCADKVEKFGLPD